MPSIKFIKFIVSEGISLIIGFSVSEKGRYRYAGQWKHGRMHGCGVYEINERTIFVCAFPTRLKFGPP